MAPFGGAVRLRVGVYHVFDSRRGVSFPSEELLGIPGSKGHTSHGNRASISSRTRLAAAAIANASSLVGSNKSSGRRDPTA